jgi:hypothetical protein
LTSPPDADHHVFGPAPPISTTFTTRPPPTSHPTPGGGAARSAPALSLCSYAHARRGDGPGDPLPLEKLLHPALGEPMVEKCAPTIQCVLPLAADPQSRGTPPLAGARAARAGAAQAPSQKPWRAAALSLCRACILRCAAAAIGRIVTNARAANTWRRPRGLRDTPGERGSALARAADARRLAGRSSRN